eukprot:4822679-Pyramimonas_sp.AAC.1
MDGSLLEGRREAGRQLCVSPIPAHPSLCGVALRGGPLGGARGPPSSPKLTSRDGTPTPRKKILRGVSRSKTEVLSERRSSRR